MFIDFNSSDEDFERLVKNYKKAKEELGSYLWREGLTLDPKNEPPAVTDGSESI